ncbi:MAG: energy transducer TonB [bacterium]
MYLEQAQSRWILPMCIIGSFIFNMWIANNFPAIFKTQKHIELPPLVEVDIEFSEAEVVLQEHVPVQMSEEDLALENLRLTELLANNSLSSALKQEDENDFMVTETTRDMKKKEIEADPGEKIVDKSSEFQGFDEENLSEQIDLDSAGSANYASFESVYVPIPDKSDASEFKTGLPRDVVNDKGDDFKKKEYGSLPSVSFERGSDQLYQNAVLPGSSSGKGTRSARGFEVTSSLVKPVTTRNVTHKVEPEYPDWAKKLGIEAVVILRFSVQPNGNVSDKIYPVQTSGYSQLDVIAIDAIKKWKFNAIDSSESAVEQWGQIAFHFKL